MEYENLWIQTGFYSAELLDEDVDPTAYQNQLEDRLADMFPGADIIVNRGDNMTGYKSYDYQTHVDEKDADYENPQYSPQDLARIADRIEEIKRELFESLIGSTINPS